MNKKISVNAILNFVKISMSIIIAFVTYPYALRVLHPENFGKINFGNSIISYFLLLATMGISTYAIRECSSVRHDKQLLGTVTSQIFSINICMMCISYLIFGACLFFVPKFLDYKLLLVIQSMSIVFRVVGIEWLNTAMEDFKYLTIRTIILQCAVLILTILLVKNEMDYYKYALVSVVPSGVVDVINFNRCKKFCNISFTLKLNLRKHAKPILLLFTTFVGEIILNNLDVTMLGFISGDYEVGLYTTAVQIISVLTQLSASIFWVFLPELTVAYENKNYNDINKLISKSIQMTAVFVFPVITGVLVLAEEIIQVVGGGEYIAAAVCLRFLCFQLLNINIGNIVGNMVLLAARKDKQYTIAILGGVLVNIIANSLIIPRYGINGAAFATVLASAITNCICIVNWDNNIYIKEATKYMISPLLGSIMLGGVCGFFKYMVQMFELRIIGAIFFSTITYVCMLVLLKNEIAIQCIAYIRKGRHN